MTRFWPSGSTNVRYSLPPRSACDGLHAVRHLLDVAPACMTTAVSRIDTTPENGVDKQVYPALDVVGWYATGQQQEQDLDTHKQVQPQQQCA